ncbi:cobalt-precorrin 5A hydrolase [Clostridium tetani]|uniref:Cobalt-precorrin 5A hydrolase n=1 Tax=Clostridium tetani TaxID=1513 RepID=A0ABY0EN07_CLOTA|nr:cobalt-precorrin 5A hydrolase [Clostridium tetani]CDI48794.1 cobalamin biosynthesis protein CbiG [Clostridium tetani 12124569]KHO39873.1 cobalamin biosynthesis protein CbiG [Clostridium tetani]RXI38366.1 cobalt-precorrin 5A hydrolase [Clostridium tetani]RXI54559.1 cobalt-precorrin 5A hydrolase [Clostridium tetani]RXI69081.1 cobalt-precorrin 5A hydrolase [Clostridium tetani]
MKIAIITITENGDKIASIIKKFLRANVTIFSKNNNRNFIFKDAVRKAFQEFEGVVFITSTGIAVRSIASYIEAKDRDPAVIVIDNSGNFVISLLSGHLGGANEISLKIAEIIKAIPVITTATDNLGVIAPDMIAKENNLVIDSLKDAKEIASLLVKGEKIVFLDEENIIPIPKGYTKDFKDCMGVVYVTNKIDYKLPSELSNLKKLKLIRKNVVLGIGCKKNYPPKYMEDNVITTLKEHNIDKRAVKSIGTVEIKKEEGAIINLSDKLQVPMKIFTIDEIGKVHHEFEGSDFVEKTIGVRSVSEPCVKLQGGKNISGKLKLNGMTLSIGIL